MARNPRGGEASEPERGNNSASSPRAKKDYHGDDVEPKKEVVDADGGTARGKKTGGSTEIRTIEYPNGDVYEGELKDNKPHGRGVCRFASGGVYDGEWKDAKKHGKGKQRWSDGSVYEGEHNENEKHGKGTLKFANGNMYVGEWVGGQCHGKGTMTYASGTVYEGDWVEGKKHGKGTTKFLSHGSVYEGDVYEGEYKDDERHGKGVYRFASGNVYEGQWMGGERQGNGTMNYSSGDVYVGEWVKGEKHGKGTAKFPSGDIYEGIWTDGQMTQGKKTAGRIERKGAGDAAPTSCELPERKLRSQRSQQRRLQKKAATKLCEHCGADDEHYKLRICTGSSLALYCSAACQKAASGPHRRICDIIAQLPSRDSDRLALEFDRDRMVDLDAGLRYGTKYMSNMKHLAIDLKTVGKDDTVKMSAKQLSSLFRSKRGTLESVFWRCESHGFFALRDICANNSLWKELHGLKQLRLDCISFDDVQTLLDVIWKQRSSLMVLCFPYLLIDWSAVESNTSLTQCSPNCPYCSSSRSGPL